MITLLAAMALGYLLGAIPSAAWVARWRGLEIFAVGSGNMGAMNTARNLGYAWGVVVLVMDVAKGVAVTWAALAMASFSGIGEAGALAVALAAGAAAVTGHAWSLYVGWRGGKGLATMLGLSLPLYPWGGLVGLLLLVALTLLTRRPHLATVLGLLAYPWLVSATALRTGESLETAFALFTGMLPLVVVSLLKHRRRAAVTAT
jgi:glycerol-3-phosphate acyltransferase PlsY